MKIATQTRDARYDRAVARRTIYFSKGELQGETVHLSFSNPTQNSEGGRQSKKSRFVGPFTAGGIWLLQPNHPIK
jgi:hypothetical protein